MYMKMEINVNRIYANKIYTYLRCINHLAFLISGIFLSHNARTNFLLSGTVISLKPVFHYL